MGFGHWPLTIVVVVLLCGFVVNLVFPFNPPRSERLLLPALPAYLMLVAAALLALWRERRILAILPAGLFVATGIVGIGMLLLAVMMGSEAGMNLGLITMLVSALLLIVLVVLQRINGHDETHDYGKTLPH